MRSRHNGLSQSSVESPSLSQEDWRTRTAAPHGFLWRPGEIHTATGSTSGLHEKQSRRARKVLFKLQAKQNVFVFLFSALLGAQRAFPPLPLTFVSHGDPSRCHARLVHTPHERPGALDSKPCCTAQLKTRSYGRQSASSARSQTRAISPFPGITRFGHPGSGENSWKASKTCELLTPETAGTSIPVDQTSFGWVLNLSCVGLLATFANLILLFNQNWNPHQTARVWLLVRLKLSRLQDLVQASQKLSGELHLDKPNLRRMR